MRTRLSLDDELLAEAESLTGLGEKTTLVREALKALVERESARRLARLGGADARARAPRRRRASYLIRRPGLRMSLRLRVGACEERDRAASAARSPILRPT